MSNTPTTTPTALAVGSEFVPIPDSYHPYADEGWRCFHCDEKFHTVKTAKAHFGPRGSKPACQVDAIHLREIESELSRYRSEDTDLHRQFHALEAKHSVALMRAEELGYERGLQDGRTLSPNPKPSDGAPTCK